MGSLSTIFAEYKWTRVNLPLSRTGWARDLQHQGWPLWLRKAWAGEMPGWMCFCGISAAQPASTGLAGTNAPSRDKLGKLKKQQGDKSGSLRTIERKAVGGKIGQTARVRRQGRIRWGQGTYSHLPFHVSSHLHLLYYSCRFSSSTCVALNNIQSLNLYILSRQLWTVSLSFPPTEDRSPVLSSASPSSTHLPTPITQTSTCTLSRLLFTVRTDWKCFFMLCF